MKKWKAIVVAVTLVVALVIPLAASSIVSANDMGLTPGYWKNHVPAWEGAAPCDTLVAVVLGITGEDIGVVIPDPGITMKDALLANGGGWNAFYRHLAAASLNYLHPDVEDYISVGSFITRMQSVISDPSSANVERIKDDFDDWNNAENVDLGPGLKGKLKDLPSC